jgi:hypothetical protein
MGWQLLSVEFLILQLESLPRMREMGEIFRLN